MKAVRDLPKVRQALILAVIQAQSQTGPEGTSNLLDIYKEALEEVDAALELDSVGFLNFGAEFCGWQEGITRAFHPYMSRPCLLGIEYDQAQLLVTRIKS